MKRLLLIIFTLIMSCGICSAYQLPRWSFFPLNVYIEPHNKKDIVEKAFNNWQNSTGLAKFRFVSSEKHLPNVVVKFSESNPNTDGSQFENAVGIAHSYTPLGYYAKATITMYTMHPGDTAPLTDEQIYGIALHEIGHAMGLSHSSEKNDIMYPIEHGQTTLSQNDITRFKTIYLP